MGTRAELVEPYGGEWDLESGHKMTRKRLHERFGGRAQGGIGVSARTPNVLIFTDPVAGEQHGYYDGWQSDGCFHYTGEGQRGDQRMISGNRSILDHQRQGRALRLFDGARGTVEYVGRFVLDVEHPWYETDAPQNGSPDLRKVIVFRLRLVDGDSPRVVASKIADVIAGSVVRNVSIEEQLTERSFVDPNREPYEAERRESSLVQDFSAYLRALGHEVCRKQIVPHGEYKPLFTDLFDETAGLLVEAKGSVTRESIRMAIGQLADYGRFVDARHRAILVESRPRPDLESLALSQGIAVVWRTGRQFNATAPLLTGGQQASAALDTLDRQ
jgi:hypothetical protein